MSRTNLIATGETIEKSYSEQEGVDLNSVRKTECYLKQLRLPNCDVRVISLMNKNNFEMTAQDRRLSAVELTSLLPHGHPVAIVHGSDTMVETALYIQKLFEHHLKVPVIWLGFEGSDGLQNPTRKPVHSAPTSLWSLHPLKATIAAKPKLVQISI
jgi:L-asparaginase/Glu-tRNA(Gln) amidotransferase subunit D